MTKTSERVAHGIGRLALLVRHLAWEGSYAQGLTPTQSSILTLLSSRPEPMGAGEIARLMAVTPPTVSDALAALERKGLICRQQGKEDRRRVEVVLTPRGREMAARSGLGLESLMLVCHRLSEEERGTLLRLVVKLIRELQREGLIPQQRMCVSCQYFRPHRFPGSPTPHYCAFVDEPMADYSLRLDCPDHSQVLAQEAERIWQLFWQGMGKPSPPAPGRGSKEEETN